MWSPWHFWFLFLLVLSWLDHTHECREYVYLMGHWVLSLAHTAGRKVLPFTGALSGEVNKCFFNGWMPCSFQQSTDQSHITFLLCPAFFRASCTSRRSDINLNLCSRAPSSTVILGTTEYIPQTPILLKLPLDCPPLLFGTACLTFYVTKSRYENLRPSEFFHLLCSPFSFHPHASSPPSQLRKRCVLSSMLG